MEKLAEVKLCQEFSDRKERALFNKHFKVFKKVNKECIRKLKAHEIENLIYEEKPVDNIDNIILCQWFTKNHIDNKIDTEKNTGTIDDTPFDHNNIDQERGEEHDNQAAEKNPVDQVDQAPAKHQDNQEQDKITRDQAVKLFEMIKGLKAYKSRRFTGQLMDILLNNNIKLIDQFDFDTDDYVASYNQTKALYRLIYGRHYTVETYQQLTSALN